MENLDMAIEWMNIHPEVGLSLFMTIGIIMAIAPRRWSEFLVRIDQGSFKSIKEKYGTESSVFLQRLFGCGFVLGSVLFAILARLIISAEPY